MPLRTLLALLIVAALALSEALVSIPPAEAQPSITIEPASGPVGALVTVKGSGFRPLSIVQVRFAGLLVATVVADANGGFRETFEAPATTSGAHLVEAFAIGGSASTTFTVTVGVATTEDVNRLQFISLATAILVGSLAALELARWARGERRRGRRRP